jgi:hypothetical protein
MNRLRSYDPRDRRGASLIEFALVLPVLALLVMGVIDLGQGFAHRFRLDQAAQQTIEMASVGAVGSDYEYLRPHAAAAAGVPLAQVTLDQWLECNGSRMATFDETCPTGQLLARYVRIDVADFYQPQFPYGPLGNAFPGRQPNGTIEIGGRATVRVQ